MITQFIDLCQDKASDLPSTREDETVAVSHHLIMEMVTEKKPQCQQHTGRVRLKVEIPAWLLSLRDIEGAERALPHRTAMAVVAVEVVKVAGGK